MKGLLRAPEPIGAETIAETKASPKRFSLFRALPIVELDSGTKLFKNRSDGAIGVNREGLGQGLKTDVATQEPVKDKKQGREDPPQRTHGRGIQGGQDGDPQRFAQDAEA